MTVIMMSTTHIDESPELIALRGMVDRIHSALISREVIPLLELGHTVVVERAANLEGPFELTKEHIPAHQELVRNEIAFVRKFFPTAVNWLTA
jgi:hypothetical protein